MSGRCGAQAGMMRRGLASAGVSLVLAACCGAAHAAEIPLPPDVEQKTLEEPFELILGAQPTKVQIYTTRLSVEGVRAFYEQRLPQQGWRIMELPWEQQMRTTHEAIEREAALHPERLSEPAAKEQLQLGRQQFTAFQEHMRGSLYAGQGTDRLLLRFFPDGGRTEVVVHRWVAQATDDAGSLLGEAAQEESPAGWPLSQPCCTGEQVPEPLRHMPSSVPPYPNGRLFMSSTMPDPSGKNAMMEFYSSSDPVEAVLAFYRERMAFNGWTLDEPPALSAAPVPSPLGSHTTEMLTYHNSQGLCLVSATEMRGLPTLDQYLAQVPPEYRTLPPDVEAMMKEGAKTVIAVSYIELDPRWLDQRGMFLNVPATQQR